MTARRVLLVFAALSLAGRALEAEPIFLARQYTRCTTCHFSPTGGGLLTPYGRSLSREELSTFGKSHSAETDAPSVREQSFLWGALGENLGGLSLGIDVRPAHLDVRFPGGSVTRDFFMTADLLAAYRTGDWTLYGEIGREPITEGAKIDSYEYWISHQSSKGLGIRAGRFLPAYGLRLADHTALTRAGLGFDIYDQILGVEVSHTSERHLFQLSAGPGRADSIFDDDGRQAFTAAGRAQFDLGARTTLVMSGLFRDASDIDTRNGSGGVALGLSPVPRLSIWTQADAQFQQGRPGRPAYVFFNQTGFEVHRGVWLLVSPQLITAPDGSGTFRTAVEVNLLPRTHVNVDLTYYRDRDRASEIVSKTWLAQLHLYL
jgi:hypothetical protein